MMKAGLPENPSDAAPVLVVMDGDAAAEKLLAMPPEKVMAILEKMSHDERRQLALGLPEDVRTKILMGNSTFEPTPRNQELNMTYCNNLCLMSDDKVHCCLRNAHRGNCSHIFLGEYLAGQSRGNRRGSRQTQPVQTKGNDQHVKFVASPTKKPEAKGRSKDQGRAEKNDSEEEDDDDGDDDGDDGEQKVFHSVAEACAAQHDTPWNTSQPDTEQLFVFHYPKGDVLGRVVACAPADEKEGDPPLVKVLDISHYNYEQLTEDDAPDFSDLEVPKQCEGPRKRFLRYWYIENQGPYAGQSVIINATHARGSVVTCTRNEAFFCVQLDGVEPLDIGAFCVVQDKNLTFQDMDSLQLQGKHQAPAALEASGPAAAAPAAPKAVKKPKGAAVFKYHNPSGSKALGSGSSGSGSSGSGSSGSQSSGPESSGPESSGPESPESQSSGSESSENDDPDDHTSLLCLAYALKSTKGSFGTANKAATIPHNDDDNLQDDDGGLHAGAEDGTNPEYTTVDFCIRCCVQPCVCTAAQRNLAQLNHDQFMKQHKIDHDRPNDEGAVSQRMRPNCLHLREVWDGQVINLGENPDRNTAAIPVAAPAANPGVDKHSERQQSCRRRYASMTLGSTGKDRNQELEHGILHQYAPKPKVPVRSKVPVPKFTEDHPVDSDGGEGPTVAGLQKEIRQLEKTNCQLKRKLQKNECQQVKKSKASDPAKGKRKRVPNDWLLTPAGAQFKKHDHAPKNH